MTKIELTKQQLETLGYELSDIRKTVEMATNMSEILSWVKLKDEAIYSVMSKKFFDTFNEQFIQLNDTLDEISFLLMNATNREEITESKFWS